MNHVQNGGCFGADASGVPCSTSCRTFRLEPASLWSGCEKQVAFGRTLEARAATPTDMGTNTKTYVRRDFISAIDRARGLIQDIDSRFTEDAEITSIGILLNQFANFVFAQPAGFSDTPNLEFGIVEADLRVKSATRCGNCIRRHRVGCVQPVFRTINSDALFDRVVQFP